MQNQDRERSEPVDYNITASLARTIPLRDPSNRLSTDTLSALRWVMEGMRTLSPKVFLNSCTFAVWAHEDAQKMSTVSQLPIWDKIETVIEEYVSFQITRTAQYERGRTSTWLKCYKLGRNVLKKHEIWKSLSRPVLWSSDRKALIICQYYKVELYSQRGKFKFPNYAVDDAAKMAQSMYNVNGEGHFVKPTADVPWVLDRWVPDEDDIFSFHPQHQDLTDLRQLGYTVMLDCFEKLPGSVQLEIDLRRAFCALPINHP